MYGLFADRVANAVDSQGATVITDKNAQGWRAYNYDDGQQTFTSEGLRFDTTGPSVSAVQPAAGAVLRGVVPARTLTATISDDLSGVEGTPYANIIVESTGQQATGTGNIPLYHQSGTTYAYTRALDTTKLADGRYQLIVTATDVAGNSTVYNQNKNDHLFTIDNVPDPVPAITSVAPTLWDGSNYKGINVDFRVKDISGLNGASVTVNRAAGGPVTREMKQARVAWVNAQDGAATSLSAPIAIQDFTLDAPNSGSWTMPTNNLWNKTTVPQSVTVTFTFADREPISVTTPVNNGGINYESLLPADNQGPTIGQRTPAKSDVIGGVHKVSAVVTDSSGVDDSSVYARFRDDAGKEYTYYLQREGNTDVFSREVNTLEIINKKVGQPNRVSFFARDLNGTSRSAVSDGVVIDNAGPTISNKTPAEGATISGKNYKVSATVTDFAGVDDSSVYARFRDDTGKEYTYYMQREAGTDTFSTEVNTTKIGDGNTSPSRVSFFARDKFGTSRSSVSDNVRIDNTAPASSNLTITPMINGNIGGTVRVTVDLTDVSGVDTNSKYTYIRFFANDNEYTYAFKKVESTTENTYEAIVNTRDFVRVNTSDIVRASLRFADNEGNGRSSKPDVLQNIRVDNSGPGSSLVSPESGSAVSGNVTLKLGFTDHTGVESARVKLSNDQVERWYDVPTITNTNGEITIDTTTLPDGEYTVGIRPVDNFGAARMGANKGTIIVDNTAPSVIKYVYSNKHNVTPDDVTVTITTSEPVNVPAGWSGDDGGTVFTKKFSENGGFYVTLVDMALNTATVGGKGQGAEVKRIDKVAPAFNIENDSIFGTNTVLVSVDEENLKTVTVNGSSVTDFISDKPYTFNVSGDDVYEVVATDKAERESRVTFIIDTTAPEVAITAAILSENREVYTIYGTTEEGIVPVVTLDGEEVEDVDVDGDSWTVTIPTSELRQGHTYTVVATATDDAGNTGTSAVEGEDGEKTDFSFVAKFKNEDAGGGTGNVPDNTLTNQNGAGTDDEGTPTILGVSTQGATTPLVAASLSLPFAASTVSNESNQVGEVLGAQNTDNTTIEDAPKATVEGEANEAEGLSFLGLAWYWWLLILAAVAAGLWWLIAALRKKIGEDE